jgi:ParB family chromosome partitioning protein
MRGGIFLTTESITYINIGLIVPNQLQPRQNFNEQSLNELAESIRKHGILNPILVRKKDDKYEIIAGERRYRAAKIVGLEQVPAIIKEVDNEEEIELAIIENLHRENISAIEEAKAYEKILRSTNMTEQELGNKIGKSQSFISNKLRLLTLPNNVQEALIQKKISEKHARSLLTVKELDKQTELLERIINEKLTVKELDNLINEKKISEEEIKNAIDDIMKSLNIMEEEEKEEKESDNMNNENFFPNYGPNPESNNNVSLNTMNQQAPAPAPGMVGFPQVNEPAPMPTLEVPTGAPMPAPPVMGAPEPMMAPEPVAPMPTPEPAVDNMVPPLQVPDMNAPSLDQPLFTGMDNLGVPPMTDAPQPEVLNGSIPVPEPMPAPPVMAAPEQVAPPVPEFNPVEMPQPEMINPLPPQEEPLFNPEPTAPQFDMSVPTPAIEPPMTDKFTEVTTLLQNNGVAYKAYHGDNGSCIIIEL